MKVLYLGVYRDGTGWGEAAERYILALDAAGVDVVPRPIKLNNVLHTPRERVVKLEDKSARGCNVVIQNILPHLMDYNGNYDLNVGLYFTETDSLLHSSWNDRLNLMDAVWGCNKQMGDAAINSFVTTPYRAIPIPGEVDRYDINYEPLPQLSCLKEEGNFVFYTVGEMVRRKNLAALLKAFHTEFAPEEPVSLVIKTSRYDMPASECRKHVEAFCTKIKDGLKLYGPKNISAYKQESIVTERLTPEEMFQLHAACDCFVQPSYGEAWSIPAFDAMALGNTPIVTDWSGFRDYVSPETGWLVPAAREQVFGVDEHFTDLYTGKESWASVDHVGLRRAMRQAYKDEGLRLRKAEAGIVRAKDFSFDKVGMVMREALEHEQEQRNHGRRNREQGLGSLENAAR